MRSPRRAAAAAGRAAGAAPLVAAPLPLLRRQLGRLRPIPGEPPRSPHPRVRSGRSPHPANRRCHAPAGCGSPPASSAGSARPGRSMLAPGTRGTGLGPSGRGQRSPPHAAPPSPRRRGHSAPPTALASAGAPRGIGESADGPATCSFPAQVEAPPPARRFRGTPLPAAVPCALPAPPAWGFLKLPRPPPLSVRVDTHLRGGSDSGRI